MLSAGSFFLLCLISFIVLVSFVALENRRGDRLFFKNLRGFLDRFIEKATKFFSAKYRFVVHHSIKMSWYYSLHAALRAIMTVLVKAYDRMEVVFTANRERAKRLRAEKRAAQVDNHLTAISEHKAAVALTPAQKKKLRARKLERD